MGLLATILAAVLVVGGYTVQNVTGERRWPAASTVLECGAAAACCHCHPPAALRGPGTGLAPRPDRWWRGGL
jgi:hypothetical protein